MRVRPARPGDAEALRAAVSRTGETAVFDDFGAPLHDASAAGVCEAAAAADCCFLVESDDRPVGLAIAHPDSDGREAELLSLWVHPVYTGEDVERKLLSRVARSLASTDVEVIRTTAPADEPATREFYRTHGFNHRETREGRGGREVELAACVEALL